MNDIVPSAAADEVPATDATQATGADRPIVPATQQDITEWLKKQFFRGVDWLNNTREVLWGLSKGTLLAFLAMIAYSLVITTTVFWHNPVVRMGLAAMPGIVVLYLLARVARQMNLFAGFIADVVTAVVVLSVVAVAAIGVVNVVAGKQVMDPVKVYNTFADHFNGTKPFVITKRVEVVVPGEPEIIYRDREVPTTNIVMGHIKAIVCPEEAGPHKACAPFFFDQDGDEPMDLGWTPKWGLAEDGWAVAGIQEDGVNEAWRIQQGWRALKPNEQRFQWVTLKHYP